MNKKQNHELIDNDNPEWTAQDIKNAIPFSGLPASLREKLSARNPKKTASKVTTTIQLSPDVIAAFKATGTDWQIRIDAALKEWLQNHSPA